MITRTNTIKDVGETFYALCKQYTGDGVNPVEMEIKSIDVNISDKGVNITYRCLPVGEKYIDLEPLVYFRADVIKSNKKTKHIVAKEKIDEIIGIVCDKYNISYKDITSKCREGELREARRILYYILHCKKGYTSTFVANCLGRSNHATVLSGCEVVQGFMESDYKFRDIVNKLIVEINGHDLVE